jgi:hypothetical protein
MMCAGFSSELFDFPVWSPAKADDSVGDPNLKQASPKKDAESRNMRGREGRCDSI